jgi:hypothetical protein
VAQKQPTMDILTQIVQVLDRYKLREIDIIDSKDSKSRYTDLYRLIKDGTIKTDEDAAKHFYGNKAKPNEGKYRVFKNEFKNRLLNTLYFIDTNHPTFTDFQTAYYAAQHQWGAINLLYRRGLISAANALAERLLTDCKKFELTDLCMLILERLKTTYAKQVGDKKKYQDFKIQFWHYKNMWEAEHLAMEVFDDIRIDYVKSTAFRPETSLRAQQALDSIEHLREQFDSFMFIFHYFAVKEAVYSAKHDWKGVITVCDETLALFEAKPFTMKVYIGIIKNQKVIALLMLKRYEECQITLNEALDLQELGNVNWFKTMEKKVLLAFHTAHYTGGYATYKEVQDLKEFKNLQGHSAEIWKLFEANFYLAGSMGLLDKNKELTLGKFKLNKFLNDIPTFGLDKKGMNIPVLVMQIALMITEKMYDALIDRIETIEKYVVRNVPKTDIANYRSNQMIKILLEIPKAGFMRKVLERTTKKLLEDLKSVPFDLRETGYKVEVLPYDELWMKLLPYFGDKK